MDHVIITVVVIILIVGILAVKEIDYRGKYKKKKQKPRNVVQLPQELE
jgi:hypothetical protein